MSVSINNSGTDLIAAERGRQVDEEGWTPYHDAHEHSDEELTRAAAAYLLADEGLWPWPDGWKPTPGDRVRQLVKAGALVAAEIDRLRRTSAA